MFPNSEKSNTNLLIQTTVNRVKTSRVIVLRLFTRSLDSKIKCRDGITIAHNIANRIEIARSQADGAAGNRVVVVATSRSNIQGRGIRIGISITTIECKAVAKVEVVHIIDRNAECILSCCRGAVEALVNESVIIGVDDNAAVHFTGIPDEVLHTGVVGIGVDDFETLVLDNVGIILWDVGDIGG